MKTTSETNFIIYDVFWDFYHEDINFFMIIYEINIFIRVTETQKRMLVQIKGKTVL